MEANEIFDLYVKPYWKKGFDKNSNGELYCIIDYKDMGQLTEHYPGGLESNSKEMKSLRSFLSENEENKIKKIFSSNEKIIQNIIDYLEIMKKKFDEIFENNDSVNSEFEKVKNEVSSIKKENFENLRNLQKYLRDWRKQYPYDFKKATEKDDDSYKKAILHGWIKFFDKGIIRGLEKSLAEIEELEDDGKSNLKRKNMPTINKLFAGKIEPKDVNQVQNGDCWLLSVMRDLAKKSPDVIKNCFDKSEYNVNDGTLKSKKIHVKLWQMEDKAPYKIKRCNILVNGDFRITGGVNDNPKYKDLPLWPIYLEEAVSILLKKMNLEWMLDESGGGGAYLAYQAITGEKGTSMEIKQSDGWDKIKKCIEKIKKAINEKRIVITGDLYDGHWCIIDEVKDINNKACGKGIKLEVSDQQEGANSDLELIIPKKLEDPMVVLGADNRHSYEKYHIAVLIGKKF